MKTRYIFLLLFVVFLFFSCKGKKQKTNDLNNNPTVIVDDSKPVVVDNALMRKAKQIYNNQDTFSTVEIKFNLKLQTSDRNVSGSGTLRIANDSIIWLYVKAFGFEVARATMTKDSVKAVVKLKNQYFKGDYSCLKQFFPVDFDFDILQSVFLNKFFFFPQNNSDFLSYYDIQESENLMKLTSNSDYKTKFGIDNKIEINENINRVVANQAVLTSNNKGISINYSDLDDGILHKLPQSVSFVGNGTDFTVTFEYQKVDYGKKLSFPLSIPSSYTPLKF